MEHSYYVILPSHTISTIYFPMFYVQVHSNDRYQYLGAYTVGY